jgi:glycosyltransferase involved in cell wall biosynthesis
MQVAIDAHMVGERETGNETYVLNLIKALLRITGRDPKGFSWDPGAEPMARAGTQAGLRRAEPRRFGATPRFTLISPRVDRLQAVLPNLPAHARLLPVSPRAALLRIPLAMPLQALRESFDLLHVTYNAPPLCPCPVVVTIHDISFERYPQFFSPRDRAVLTTLVPLSARRAARIITVSQHARDEIVARYRVPREKVAVTYEAASEHFRPIEDQTVLQAVRRKLGIGDGPFLLALGNLQPRKNIGRLIEAFARMVSQQATRQDQGKGYGGQRNPITVHRSSIMDSSEPGSPIIDVPTLVIAGQAQWLESELYKTVARVGVEGRILFPGYVDEADLPALYSAATAFVFPSLYEGFGLPPLEAMACGTPVICSNAASLPEVVADAALSIDPTDVDALAQAMQAMLTSPGLRRDLRQRGLHRAARFSWDRCALETLAVYRDVVQASR